ncbi:MAG: hypothetical protein RIQ56_993, partial [Candidatus Parcubacteria bacterium]
MLLLVTFVIVVSNLVPNFVSALVCSPSPVTCTSGQLMYAPINSSQCPSGGYYCVQGISATRALQGSAKTAAAPLLFGARSQSVRTLQMSLILLGYLPNDSATGYFGSRTLEAIRKFQCDKLAICSGTPSTTGYGSFGRKTQTALVAALAAVTISPFANSKESGQPLAVTTMTSGSSGAGSGSANGASQGAAKLNMSNSSSTQSSSVVATISTTTSCILPQSQIRVLACPVGHSGSIVQTRRSTCISAQPTWEEWQTSSHTCTAQTTSAQSGISFVSTSGTDILMAYNFKNGNAPLYPGFSMGDPDRDILPGSVGWFQGVTPKIKGMWGDSEAPGYHIQMTEAEQRKIYRQHAYWLSKLKIAAVVFDVSNYSCTEPKDLASQSGYYAQSVAGRPLERQALRILLDEWAKSSKAFPVPKIAYFMRVESDYGPYNHANTTGLEPDGKINLATCMANELYDLYLEHPDQWYTITRGPEASNKPFLEVITNMGPGWRNGVANGVGAPWRDERFNIRYTGVPFREIGFTYPSSFSQILFTRNDWPFWSFQEPWEITKPNDLKIVARHVGTVVEYAPAWVSMWNRVANWENTTFTHEWDSIGSLTPFSDATGNYSSIFAKFISLLKQIRPLVIQIHSWNYDGVTRDVASEGHSATKNANIEPSDELGFKVYYEVMRGVYDYLGLAKSGPAIPTIIYRTDDAARVVAQLGEDALEYCFYDTNKTTQDCPWNFVNANYQNPDKSYFLDIPFSLQSLSNLSLVTRNAFGTSNPVRVPLKGVVQLPPDAPTIVYVTSDNTRAVVRLGSRTPSHYCFYAAQESIALCQWQQVRAEYKNADGSYFTDIPVSLPLGAQLRLVTRNEYGESPFTDVYADRSMIGLYLQDPGIHIAT